MISMGYYTELKCKIVLRKDTPDEVIVLLKRVIIDGDWGIGDATSFTNDQVFKPEIQHPFFKCPRWLDVFVSVNCDWDKGSKFYQKNNYWILNIHTDYKNYDDERDHFLDWITPYVAGRKKRQYIGWFKGEDVRDRCYIHIEREAQSVK
jgi:hypothetical protein